MLNRKDRCFAVLFFLRAAGGEGIDVVPVCGWWYNIKKHGRDRHEKVVCGRI